MPEVVCPPTRRCHDDRVVEELQKATLERIDRDVHHPGEARWLDVPAEDGCSAGDCLGFR